VAASAHFEYGLTTGYGAMTPVQAMGSGNPAGAIGGGTMGGLAVGNYDNPADHGSDGLPFGPGHAVIYDIDSDTFLTDIVFPGAKSNSAYGIWWNGGTSYTIVGGYAYEPVNDFDAEPLAQLDLRHAEGLTPVPDLGTEPHVDPLVASAPFITC
jgi:hypothetical protein